jgi:cytochrome c peroxidase
MLRRFAELSLAALLVAAPAAAQSPMLGLPPVAYPADNQPSAEKIALGRKLFFDRRLSANGTLSCANCHVPEEGFAQNSMRMSVGHEGRSLRRNAPTIINVAYYTQLFHDGREASLEAQVWAPLLAADEMANPSADALLARIAALPDYAAPMTATTVSQALAAYQRSLVAGDSRFDRWWFGGDKSALTEEERHGFHLFQFKAGCAQCHVVGDAAALFTDLRFHNTGTGHERIEADKRSVQVQLVPGLVAHVQRAALATFGEAPAADRGRMEKTGDAEDRWKYRTPSLRNVALTAPYMHDGSLATLEDVVAFYDRGGGNDPQKADYLFPLGLGPADQKALVAFLKTLTGSNIDALLRDARGRP